MASPPDELAQFAGELADTARPILQRYFRNLAAASEKADRTPVTEADRQVEAALRAAIAARYPHHGIVGEEYGRHTPEAEFVWVLDPIDGTRAFIAGQPLFGTLIALLHRGQPVVGTIDQPILQERWLGIAGRGSFFNGRTIGVRAERPLAQTVGFSSLPELLSEREWAGLAQLRSRAGLVRYEGDCYAYGLLALGQIDWVIERDLAPYDFCALVPVVQEAGGYIADWQGNPLTLAAGDTTVAASSRQLAAQVAGTLAPIQ